MKHAPKFWSLCPPILVFSFSSLVSFRDFPCLFVLFQLFSKDFNSSTEKDIIVFSGDPGFFFCQKNQDWRVRVFCGSARFLPNFPPKFASENQKKTDELLQEQAGKLKSYDPAGHLKKCRSPGQEKCRKSASESAGPKRGAEKSAEKSAPGPVSYTTST